MKRALLLAALAALLASSAVLAEPPPSIWWQDSFDTDPYGKLAYATVGGWGGAQVIEPGTTSPWPDGTTDVNVMGVYTDCTGVQYGRYVWMKGEQGNMIDATVMKGIAAETQRANPPSGVGWDDRSPGQVQILYFKMKRAADDFDPPIAPLHAGVYLIDNDPVNPQPIMGFQANARGVKSQLLLPTYDPGLVLPDGNFSSAEGDLWEWTPLDDACHEFTAVYDPATGEVKFYVDDDLFSTLNAGTGRVSRSVYVRDYMWYRRCISCDGCYCIGEEVLVDDVAVGSKARPVVTAPVGGTFVTTATPAITWNKAFPAETRTSYQVKVCASDDPDAAPVTNGDSGTLTDPDLTEWTPSGALSTCQHLWAFVTETYATSTGWSMPGNGGFYCVTAAPPAPTLTSPSGTVVGAKPSVIFSGTCYNQFEVKVTTDPAGSTVVWTSGVVSSLLSGASCETMLTPGTQYYAFAQATNPLGASAWSAASPFQVTRTGEGTDIRNMEETWLGSETVLDHSAAAPDDGFADYCGGGRVWGSTKKQILPDPWNRYADTNGVYPNYQPCDWWPSYENQIAYVLGYWIIPPIPDRTAPSYVLDIWDIASDWNSNEIRQHRVANLSLDKGVTLMTYASGHCHEGEGCGMHDARQAGQEAQIYVMDDYGSGKCMASFRYGQGEVGICTDNATWIEGLFTDCQHDPNDCFYRPGEGWHLVRITGRNRVIGDPTTCEWNYYLDENPTPLISGTGVMDQSIACYGSIVDAIAIGQGDGGLAGNWQYDWTAVNTDGDYAPGEWFYGDEYATLSEAVAEGRGKMVKITGETVITAIKLVTGTQVGFWVQDVDTTDYSNIYIPSTETTDVERGHKVTGVSGLLQWSDATGASLASPGFTVTTTDASWPPVTMQQKALVGGGYPTEHPEGTLTVGKFAQITGKITDLLYLLDGSYAIYLDDGCGLIDGRSADGGNPLATGVRVIHPEPWAFFGAVGDYYEVRGICASETADDRTVRTLLGPNFTEVAAP